MGGDIGPAITVPAISALRQQADFILCGDQTRIKAQLGKDSIEAGLTVIHAPDSISMDQGLRRILRDRRPTALRAALDALADNRADAVVSAADTGALMALARHRVGMLEQVDRPAIAKEIIGKRGTFWMADLGANTRCTPEQLLQFARMGVVAAQSLSKQQAPRVALLNIGTEQGKGPNRLSVAGELLQSLAGVNFVGFIEGSRLFDNEADVIVCEGFVGNVTLKAMEGTAAMAQHLLTEQLEATRGWQRWVLSMLRPTLRRVRGSLDTDKYNGAAFLGLRKVVIKSHGAATQAAFAHALQRAVEAVRGAVPEVIADGLGRSSAQPLTTFR